MQCLKLPCQQKLRKKCKMFFFSLSLSISENMVLLAVLVDRPINGTRRDGMMSILTQVWRGQTRKRLKDRTSVGPLSSWKSCNEIIVQPHWRKKKSLKLVWTFKKRVNFNNLIEFTSKDKSMAKSISLKAMQIVSLHVRSHHVCTLKALLHWQLTQFKSK